jgi:hypothetical protein
MTEENTMNSGRLIGIILGALGFGIAVIAGLWFSFQASQGVSMGGVLVGAFLAFIPVALLIGFGVLFYVRGGKEEERESTIRKQRDLMDILRSRGQVSVHEMAIELNESVDSVKDMLNQLVGLQVFAGYINWKDGTLYSAEAKQLQSLEQCKVCGGEIALAGKGVVACKYCGTEYFLP